MARPKTKFSGIKEALEHVPQAQNLFRHRGTGTYYARTRRGGKDLVHSLGTCDRRAADSALHEWLRSLDEPKTKAGSFGELLDKFLITREILAEKTQENDKLVVRMLRDGYPGGVNIPLSRVTTEGLIGWVIWWAGTKNQPKAKAATYNRYRSTLQQIFKYGVEKQMYTEANTPFRPNRIPKREEDDIIRNIPSEKEFVSIISHVRGQKYNAEKDKTGDFLEFMGRAGLGQAEVANIRLRDIDFNKGEIAVWRKKTGKPFDIPIYEWARAVLCQAIERMPEKKPDAKVFQIQDAKKALTAACKKFGFPIYSQRDLRAMHIGRLWRSKVDVKLIAKWQGHNDGGKLILSTYTEVFSAEDVAYKKAELAKAAAYVPV